MANVDRRAPAVALRALWTIELALDPPSDEPPIPATIGRCFVYVFPCAWEDHCKIGFSRDPLGRLQALHRRWFEFFDLDRSLLVQTETVRDARDLELELRRPLSEHRAPAPLTVRPEAGGQTEWVRGAGGALTMAIELLEQAGYPVHRGLRPWLRAAMLARSDILYAWTQAQLSIDEIEGLAGPTRTAATGARHARWTLGDWNGAGAVPVAGDMALVPGSVTDRSTPNRQGRRRQIEKTKSACRKMPRPESFLPRVGDATRYPVLRSGQECWTSSEDAMDVSFTRVLNACILVAGLHCQGLSAHGSACPGAGGMDGLESQADIERAAQELRAEIAKWARHDYSVEKAMGASCPKDPEQQRQSSGLIHGACRGPGPAHLIGVLRALQDDIDWPEQSRSALDGGQHRFVAVPGLGERPDFMMMLGRSWIRSLEGPNPDTTHFLVSAPFPGMDDSDAGHSWPVSPLRGDCAGHQPWLRVYAVERGKAPRNVTSEVLPRPPTLALEESQRYGPYIARIQSACDSDIHLETGNLQHVSTMRWSLTDFDPETPIPTSDLRQQGNVGHAHFGFLVWNGSAFEQRQRVARSLWPCSPAASCGGIGDRFVIEAAK